MGVAEEGDAVRAKSDDLINGVGEAFGRLVRQAIDQVDVNAVKAKLACGDEQIAGHFEWLDAVNRLLHFGMEILDAHAEAIEAQLAKRFEVRSRRDTGIDFDADFAVWRKVETLARKSEEVFDLHRGKIRGRAAAPMELHNGAIFRNATADALRFTLEHIQIRRRDTFVFLNHHVAGAEQAKALAEGDMHV